MAEEFFFHYTSKKAAKEIIFEGKIRPSLAANGDAIHGDGVYLTTLEPRHGEDIIKNNNWDGVAATKTNIEVYFEIVIPSSKVVRADDTRDIQVYKGSLQLIDFKWNLKNWDGELLATQYFMVSSEGGAQELHGDSMGRYTLSRDIVTMQGKERSYVYKKDEGSRYLYASRLGCWTVGKVAGDDWWLLRQPKSNDKPYYTPAKIEPWKHSSNDGGKYDKTLKVYPCYF